jgi:plasmid stabilization system protein ParE
MLPVVWLRDAHAELDEALFRYERIRPELAERFAAGVLQAVEAIAAAPLHYAVVDKGRRRVGIRRFPYGLYFMVEEERIVVIACFHGKRHPSRWQSR